MAGFKISGFRGRYPGVERRVLPEGVGTVATDLKVGYGDIRPLFGSGSVVTELVKRDVADGAPKALLWYQSDKWVHMAQEASFVVSPAGTDEWERLVISVNEETDDPWPLLVAGKQPATGVHEVTNGAGPYPQQWFAFGVPAPTTRPTASLIGGGGGSVEDQRTFYYCFTLVNDRGEESAPSLPTSFPVVFDESASFAVQVICQALSSYVADSVRGISYREAKQVYVYRLYSEDETRTWMYAGSADIGNNGTATFIDTTPTVNLDGDTLETASWDAAPLGVKGIKLTPGGSVVGFRGREVIFSEPAYPYAFPVSYRYGLDFDVVALGIFGSTIVALTTGQPYLLMGNHPAEMTPVKVEADQACVSARSVVEFGDRVLWASPDGIFSIGANGVEAVTIPYMDKRTWQAEFAPTSIHAYGYEGRYVAFYDTGSKQGGFTINPYVSDDGLVDLSTYATAGFRDLETDTLYLALPSGAYYGVFAFDSDADAPLEWEWASRVIEFPKHASPGCAQVLGTSYPFEIDTSYLSDTGVLTAYDAGLVASSRNPKRLRAGALMTDWIITVRGTGECEAIILAETMADLRSV